MQDARKVSFQELAEDRRSSSPTLLTKFTIPEIAFSNFSNLFGRKIRKKSVRLERVTLQSIMARSWKNIINNLDESEKAKSCKLQE